MPRRPRILVVDDALEMARLLGDQLGDLGYQVEIARDGAHALDVARAQAPDLVLTDVRMPRVDGLELLDALLAERPNLPVIVMTGFGSTDQAVDAMRRGAFHYLPKPFRLDDLQVQVQRGLDAGRSRAAVPQADQDAVAALVGDAPAMAELRSRILRAARVDAPVLVRGESGTGKELVARAVHQASARRGGPFVAVNCSALPANLLESELFGHDRGAFTGAVAARKGLFVEAEGGTLFLDELGDMPVELQGRLLRVLEDRRVRPVGSDKDRPVDVRLVAATHQPLEQRVAEGRFRGDLLFRLEVVPLRLPPLRERAQDVPALVACFLAEARSSWPAMVLRTIEPDAMDLLAAQPWPGNVRQLRNVVQRLGVLLEHPVARVADVAEVLGAVETAAQPAAQPPLAVPTAGPFDALLAAGLTLEQVQDGYISAVMAACGGNKTKAARILGVNPSTLFRWERRGG